MPFRPPKHKAGVPTARRTHDARPSASARGYDRVWRKAAAGYKAKHPCCVHCLAKGLVTEVFVVDHIEPHRLYEAIKSGDEALILRARQLFWDSTNWQSLCETCHNRKTVECDGGLGRDRKIG